MRYFLWTRWISSSQRESWTENPEGPLLDGAMMRCGRGRQLHVFLLIFLCLGELTSPAEGRGAVGKGGRSFKGRSGSRGGGRGGGDQDPLNSLSSLHWWQVRWKKGESYQISELQAWLVLGLLVCVIASCLGQCCCRLVNTPTAKSLRWTANLNHFGICDFLSYKYVWWMTLWEGMIRESAKH